MAAFFLRQITTTKDRDALVFPHGMKIWYDPGAADVDIVFVHGLAGNRERTWTHSSASEPWPKTLLPAHLPGSRILAFGYDAYIVQKGVATTNQLVDYSRDFLNSLTSLREISESSTRPLILVGHSLGGVICKDAILQSRNNPEPHLRNVFHFTRAIAFLGTPHEGSDLSAWANIPAHGLGVLKSTNANLLSILQTSSEVLYRIQNDFLSMIRDLQSQERQLKITCFWESLPMPIIGTVIARASASLPGYNAISIHANHKDMVKFDTLENPGFLSVLGELKRWVREVGYSSPVVQMVDTMAEEVKQQKLECLKSLTFPEISARKSNIDKPNAGTCEWIFNNSRYKSWDLANGSVGLVNLLWIKGKPGSGKSTLMKSITGFHDEQKELRQSICCSFFFNARGTSLENSPLGFYQTLLFQLLQSSEPLLEEFLPRFLEKEKDCPGQKVAWQTPELSDFFHSAITNHLSRPAYIFIDALDECKEEEIRKIVKRFEDSLAIAASKGRILKICLSSRHYPHIGLRSKTSQEIFMENHNRLDIRTFIDQEFLILEQHLRHNLTATLVAKSAGLFLWTSFMVRRLLKAFDQGYTAEQMKALLDSVPPTLEGLFEETLHSMGSDRLASLSVLAPWIISSLRPLLLYEVYVAASFDDKIPPLSLADPRFNAFDQERFKKHLIDASGGLFETSTIHEKIYVQVIHETVREFFLTSSKLNEMIGVSAEKSFSQHGHEKIVKAGCRFFRLTELRQPLPHPDAYGQIAWKDLANMFHRPLMISFELLTAYGITYLHDHVFDHMVHLRATDFECYGSSCEQCAKTIFEGWLVFLYYVVIHTGSLSLCQRWVLNLLIEHAHLLELDTSDLVRIMTCIDNLIIFVNKAMKDGFTLKGASNPHAAHSSIFLEQHPFGTYSEDVVYLRVFWNGAFQNPLRGFVTERHNDLWDGSWIEYASSVPLKDIASQCNEGGVQFGLGFCLVVAGSNTCDQLETCWSRSQFPLCNIPIHNWRIVEQLKDLGQWRTSRKEKPQSPSSEIEQGTQDWEPRPICEPWNDPYLSSCLVDSSHQSRNLGWNSITLKCYPPGSIAFAYPPAVYEMHHRLNQEGRSETWLHLDKEVSILAVREDWEVKHYSLCGESTQTIKEEERRT